MVLNFSSPSISWLRWRHQNGTLERESSGPEEKVTLSPPQWVGRGAVLQLLEFALDTPESSWETCRKHHVCEGLPWGKAEFFGPNVCVCVMLIFF